MNDLEKLNSDFLDLYGDSLKSYIVLPSDAKIIDIVKEVDKNSIAGYKHFFVIGGNCVIAQRKYTWSKKVAKTSYLHIYVVNNFKDCKVLQHWKEQRDGNFKLL